VAASGIQPLAPPVDRTVPRKKSDSRSPKGAPHPGADPTGAAPAAQGGQARPAPRRALLAGLAWVLVLAAGVGLWTTMRPADTPEASRVPGGSSPASAHPPAAYVDNADCLRCHVDQGRLWTDSHHAKAMAPATAETVLGDFGGAEFTHEGITSRFFRRDERFFVRTDGPDGKPAEFEVAYTFGIAPLQQYLIPMAGGRLQPLQIAWDEPRRRWFHLLPNEDAPAGDVLHWTGRYQTANTMCISCHTTGFEKRYDAATDTFSSRWKEHNVSCQSCHGPGGRHVEWAEATAAGRPAATLPGERLGLGVDFRTGGGKAQVETCSGCHSRRAELTASPVPGAPRLDHYLPSLLQPGLYHADGQQLDEVFVDGSYRQSRMYQAGVPCTACHEPHTGKPKHAGNAVCTQCHAPQPDPAFPAAAGRYDAPDHHFHPAGSPGAQCVACHMPSKDYMRIQARPDHSMRIPRPDLSVKIGVPNACTQCHDDKPAQWAADQVARWYGPGRRQEPHFGEAFAAARAGRPGAAQAVAEIAADRGRPGIVRATALDLLRGEPLVGDSMRISATRDPDPEVRAAAADSLEPLPAATRVHGLAPLLTDPVRAVRIAAARALSSLPPAQLDPALRPAFDAALAEYVAAQSVSLDMPGARLNLAVVHRNTGKPELAEREYLAALRIDPDFTPARANLARLYNASGRNADAERVLKDGLARLPDLGELQYSLGLLLAEEKRLPEAARVLERAAALLPDRAKVHYTHGLALQQLGQRDAAAAALSRAQKLDPFDASTPYALAVLHAQAGWWEEALKWGETLQALDPANPQVRQFVERLRSRR
jgi:tetratricopeptide (TPR) repeat protein